MKDDKPTLLEQVLIGDESALAKILCVMLHNMTRDGDPKINGILVLTQGDYMTLTGVGDAEALIEMLEITLKTLKEKGAPAEYTKGMH